MAPSVASVHGSFSPFGLHWPAALDAPHDGCSVDVSGAEQVCRYPLEALDIAIMPAEHSSWTRSAMRHRLICAFRSDGSKIRLPAGRSEP